MISWFRLALPIVCFAAPLLAQSQQQTEFFEKQIRPILAAKCQVCHNAQLKTAELDLSSAEGFLRGGATGPLVDPDNPTESRLLKVLSYDERMKMPPTGKLGGSDIAAITTWVNEGAHWPGVDKAKVITPTTQAHGFTDEQKNFWAFQPVADPPLPKVQNESWVRSPIDRFILARLEEKGLRPSTPANKATLLRRATFDLTGLPPTEREIADFLADEFPDAFAKVVDRLLASPRYGERGGVTGSTWPATPTPPATTKTIAIPMLGAIATMSSRRSTTTALRPVRPRANRRRPAARRRRWPE
jgi:hypothetical protein